MKFELTRSFIGDRARLSASERGLVTKVLPDFVAACDRLAADPAAKWPGSLRVKPVENAPGIWEVTLNFSGPDIRATFEWIDVNGERAVRWRRLSGHSIFKDP